MLRINTKLINESHIIEIDQHNSNFEITLSNGTKYDVGMIKQRVSPYHFIELSADELEQLAVRLKRY